MKATSIEQIREHLARGGRVMDHNRDEVDGLGHVCVYYKHVSSIYPIKDLTPDKLSRWELLPIEEEKNVVQELATLDREFIRLKFRDKVLFGQPWSMEEQREVWEWLTGERIEWGRRCNECECSGRINRRTVHEIDCPECNGDGYTVRPTWMGEVKG